jgi:hypothetical protein
MTSKSKNITSAIAFFLIFAISQVYVGVSFARPAIGRNTNVATMPQQATGVLTTRGNKPIAVNGASAVTGATIVSGTNIETPEGVSAKVALGALGWLDIAPKAELALTFDQSGSVKVLLSQGCVVLHTRKNTTGQIDTVNGMMGKSDPTKDDVLRVCSRPGAVPPADIGGSGGAATGMSTKTGAIIGLLGDAAMISAAIIVPCRRGRNPSPGVPRGRNDECR